MSEDAREVEARAVVKKVIFQHTWHPRDCICERGKTIFTCPAVDAALDTYKHEIEQRVLRELAALQDNVYDEVFAERVYKLLEANGIRLFDDARQPR